MVKLLSTTIQNLVTQDLCIPDLKIKRKQNLVVVLITAADIYTCQNCRMCESCALSVWAFKLVDLLSSGINTWSAVNGSCNSRNLFTNRCMFIKTLITIYIKIRWLLHVSVYNHHQGACNWTWLKLNRYYNIQWGSVVICYAVVWKHVPEWRVYCVLCTAHNTHAIPGHAATPPHNK